MELCDLIEENLVMEVVDLIWSYKRQIGSTKNDFRQPLALQFSKKRPSFIPSIIF